MGLSSQPADKAPVMGSPNRDLQTLRLHPRKRQDGDNQKTDVPLCLAE